MKELDVVVITGPLEITFRSLGAISKLVQSVAPCELSVIVTHLPVKTLFFIIILFIDVILEYSPRLQLSPILISGFEPSIE